LENHAHRDTAAQSRHAAHSGGVYHRPAAQERFNGIFSTIMTLVTPQDVTLQELRIETFFPADGESEAHWMRMTAQTTP
jgi:hypothetical protein